MDKPYITCLMECSVDGRLDRERWSALYDSNHDEVSTIYYNTLNSLHPDGNLIGLNTARAFFSIPEFKIKAKSKILSHSAMFRGIRDEVKITAIFDFDGTLAYRSNKIFNSNIIAILGKKLVSNEYLRYLRTHEISYTFAGEDGTDLHAALKSLHDDFGMHQLVLEGGGTLNGSFLKEGLIDQLVVVIYPGLDGLSGVKSIFEYQGKPGDLPAKGQRLELIDCQSMGGGVVKLSYKIHKDITNNMIFTRAEGIACKVVKK